MLKVKICGMKNLGNISEIANLKPDFMGFIFVEKSPRYVGENFIAPALESINKVGVFVNESIEKVIEIYKTNNLDYVQLHGEETPEYCSELQKIGINTIKVFLIENELNYSLLNNYEKKCDYFLFDTFSKLKGGSGMKFNWKLLANYNLQTPFFLSGGISETDIEFLNNLDVNKLIGIDINSKFEIEPGLKDTVKLNNFLQQLNIN